MEYLYSTPDGVVKGLVCDACGKVLRKVKGKKIGQIEVNGGVRVFYFCKKCRKIVENGK